MEGPARDQSLLVQTPARPLQGRRLYEVGQKNIVKTLTQPQPTLTLVGLDTKMTSHTTPHKFNVCNISAAATDPILMKL